MMDVELEEVEAGGALEAGVGEGLDEDVDDVFATALVEISTSVAPTYAHY